jgi:hypothetical protein
MSTVFNHSRHFTAEQFKSHDEARYQDILEYGGLDSIRAIPCSNPGDIVQLDPRLKNDYPYIRNHWEEVGLETSENILWGVEASDLAQAPEDFSVYHFTPDVHAVRPDIRRMLATQHANDKNSFISYCESQGYPVPRTITVEPGSTPDLSSIRTPAFVKAAESQAGVSILKAMTDEELEAHVGEFRGVKFQIQEAVEDAVFVNVQYKAIGGRAIHLATSEQLLNGFTHIGNRFPTHHDPRDITDKLAIGLSENGLKGIFAFDVAIPHNGDNPEAKIIECNPRWNGASYPTAIGDKLGIDSWQAIGVNTPHETIRDIDLSDLAYDRTKGFGAIVTGFVFKPNKHIVNVMLAGPPEAQEDLAPQVMERLTSKALAQKTLAQVT